MTDDQKSIVIDVQMPRGEKRFALQFDKVLRECTQECRKFALNSGIGKGDEVIFTINYKDQFSYLKKTGKTFKLDELPQPATKEPEKKPIIDADKEQQKKEPAPNGNETVQSLQHPAQEGRYPTQEELLSMVYSVDTYWKAKLILDMKSNERIGWQALLNTATKIVEISGSYIDLGDELTDEMLDTEKVVKEMAERLHTFIMEKVDGGK